MTDDRPGQKADASAQAVDLAAADWAARLDRGLSFQERDTLERWLRIDRRHVGALARARAVWIHAERAAALGPGLADHALTAPPYRVGRRAVTIGAGALAASLAAVAVFPLIDARRHRVTSNIGEIRRIALADGSAVTLDTDTELQTAFDDRQRRIDLLSGQAYFEVAHDERRPFIVRARGVSARAVGTAFSVRNIAGAPIAVTVSEGRVEVSRRDFGRARIIAADMQATVPAARAATAITTLDADAVSRALAWRSGMLSFAGEALGTAAAQFDRYGGPHIAIADPALAAEPITGLFAANDPRGFARAVALSFDAEATQQGDVIRLSPAPPRKESRPVAEIGRSNI